MIGSKRALALAALLLASSTALAVDTTYTFTSVKKIEFTSPDINLTGVLAGDTAPSTVTLPSPNELCTGYMETLLKNPGAYILSVTTVYQDFPNGTYWFATKSCSLEVAP